MIYTFKYDEHYRISKVNTDAVEIRNAPLEVIMSCTSLCGIKKDQFGILVNVSALIKLFMASDVIFKTSQLHEYINFLEILFKNEEHDDLDTGVTRDVRILLKTAYLEACTRYEEQFNLQKQ